MDNKKEMHREIKEYLRDLIESGKLTENAKMPSEHDLAKKFGVNRNWPRRALRELEVEGYVLRSQGKRSVVAPISARRQAFCIGKVPTLAIALPEYQDLFDRTIADGFMGYAAQHEVHSLIYNIRLDEEDECKFLLKAPEIGIAGLAFWPQHDSPGVAEALAVLRRRHFPVVQVDRYVRDTETDFVVTDNETMMHTLTTRMIDRGHKRIAFISVFEDVSSVRDRVAGFNRALKEHGLPINEKYFSSVYPADIASVRGAVTDIMGYREPPTAILCIHDNLAGNVLKELDRLDYRVPEHVELAAVDDMYHTQTMGFPLLKIRQQGGEMGRVAAEMLLSRLYDPDLPVSQQFLPPVMEGANIHHGNHGSAHLTSAPGYTR